MSRWPKTKRRFHKDTYSGNRWNLGDFILWQGYKKGDKIYWDTDIGRGRPAWNIQDPAMVTRHLGFKVDINCGGIDNIIRHHDYIIAIIESISNEPFARYWLHGAHLYVNGKKMSKSVGNITYPRNLLQKGYDWNHIRFFLIYGHYSKKLNFTWARYKETCAKLQQLQSMVNNLNGLQMVVKESSFTVQNLVVQLKTNFEENMNNDLHVKDAFDMLYNTVSRLVTLKKRAD
jgi:cysteinyl-tRNA synthetase